VPINPALLQGLADAVAGGALAGLSKEAGSDFFSPFLQAQQGRIARETRAGERAEDRELRTKERGEDKSFATSERVMSQIFQAQQNALDRQERQESNAFSNFSQSSKASREAFASEPLAEGRYDAYVSNAQKRLQMALESAQSPAARQALTDTYEADIAFADSTARQAKEKRNLNQGMRGDFGWVDDTEEAQTTLTALLAEGSPLSKTFQSALTFAEQFKDQSTGVFDASALPATALNSEERELVTAIGQVNGGLPAYVAQNPDDGRRILKLLSKVDPGSLGARSAEIGKIRDDNQFFERLNGMVRHDERAAKLKPLNERGLWQIDPNGVRSFRPSAIGQVIDKALESAGPTRNAAIAWQMMENTYGKLPNVDLSNVQAEIFQQGNLGKASADDIRGLIAPTKQAGIGLFEKGIPALNAQDRALIDRGDLSPIIAQGYTIEEAETYANLNQSNGRNLVLEPVMNQFIGTRDEQSAEMNLWQDRRDEAAALGDERGLEQADAEVKRIQAFQSNPAVDVKISTLTEMMLTGAADGDWSSFLQTMGAEKEGLLNPETGKLSKAAQEAWDNQVMREGLSPANQVRAAARWASSYNLVFHQDSQIGSETKLNPLAQAKFLDVAERWAQTIEQEQMSMGAGGRQFLGVEDGRFNGQQAFLRMTTLQSLDDLGKPKQRNLTEEQKVDIDAQIRSAEAFLDKN